jgi:hypothetical protein
MSQSNGNCTSRRSRIDSVTASVHSMYFTAVTKSVWVTASRQLAGDVDMVGDGDRHARAGLILAVLHHYLTDGERACGVTDPARHLLVPNTERHDVVA